MTPARRLILFLAGLSLLIHFGLTTTWSDDAEASRRETQRLLNEQRNLHRQLVPLERNAALRTQATGLIGRSASAQPTAAAVQRVRTSVVKALGGSGRSRLEVRRGPAPAIATVTLATEGSFFEMVELAGTLGRPGSGLVLRNITLSPSPVGASLTTEALALGDPQ